MVKQVVTLAAANMLVEHDKSRNIEKIIGFVEEATRQEADLLVLPECCLQGYLWTWDFENRVYLEDEEQRRYFHDTAELIPGPSTDRVAELAMRHNMLIQIGIVEKSEEEGRILLHNSVALMGPDGLIGVFRKVHSRTEGILLTRGRELKVFETFLGKVGPIICADLLYPETVRVLALKGADIVTMSSAWGLDPKTDYQGYQYDLLTRATALTNGVWMVVSDQVGAPTRSEERCYGHSRIIDPTGMLVAGTGYDEGLVTARVDVKRGMRPNRWPARCPECYAILVSKTQVTSIAH